MVVGQLSVSFNRMTFRVSSKPFELSDARSAQVDESGILAWARGISFQEMTDAQRDAAFGLKWKLADHKSKTIGKVALCASA